VKVLHSHLAADAEFLERFRREAVAAARLAHPNIVAVFDTGVDEGTAFIVMELVRGSTLRELLVQQGGVRPARAVQVAVQVADALQYAHGHGTVHRDVKPGNVLITDEARVKVTDFGIAKAAEAAPGTDLTQTGAIVGTARYLSPEQVNGAPQDGRSDVYSLGVVLYEMLCGRPPYTGDTELAIAMQHVNARPVSPRLFRAGIPRSLEAVVLKAMATSPGDRFDTAGDMRAALAAIDLVDDDAAPMVTRDATPPEGIPLTFAQSERSWLIPVVVIVLLALALGTVGVLFARNASVREFLNPNSKPKPPASPATVRITGVAAFDPLGDDHEHDGEAANAIDGDPGTVWRTETYANRRLGNRKPGVGLVLTLATPARLASLSVSSPSHGYAAQVFVAGEPRTTLAAWGDPVDAKTGVDGDTTFDLRHTRGAAILLWITDLGDVNATQIADLRIAT
jgi:serine/threonine protein kinase